MAKLSDLKTLLGATARDQANARARVEDTVARARAPREVTPSKQEPRVVAPSEQKPPHIARSLQQPRDVDLQQAFADVARLPPRNRAQVTRARPAPIAKMRLHDEADALAASKYGVEVAATAWDIGQEIEPQQTFLRTRLSSDVLTKLRRGKWSVQGELDLHGLTAEEAREALADFLLAARQAQWRCVRVIHGKGLSSPQREPILKGKVRRWLGEWDQVLAYCEAPRHAGGSGAVIVLLKGRVRSI